MKKYIFLFAVLAALAGSFFVGYSANAAPIFYKVPGFPVSSIICGDTYTFDVPGYTTVWIKEWKAGNLIYDKQLNVPKALYSICNSSEGTYILEAYTTNFLTGQPDQPLGTTSLSINPISTPTPDTIPPVILSSQPSGTISAPATPTTNVTLGVTTNEPALCKYSYLQNQTYAYDMNAMAADTTGKSHSVTLSGLGAGNSWKYYVKCADLAGWIGGSHYAAQDNVTPSDYLINFTIPAQVTPTLVSKDLQISAYWDIPSANSAYQAKWDYDSNGLMNYTDSLLLAKIAGRLASCASGKDCDFDGSGRTDIGDALVYSLYLQKTLNINKGSSASGVIYSTSGSGGTVTIGSNPAALVSPAQFILLAGGNTTSTFNIPSQNTVGSVTQSFSGSIDGGSQIYSNTLQLQVTAVNVVYPTVNMSCSLLVDKTQINTGQSATWTMNSDWAGYKIYWFGTKNGVSDVIDSNSGFITNKTWLTDPYPAGAAGDYTRYFKIHEFSPSLNSNVACTSNTVSFSVLTVPTSTLLGDANIDGKVSTGDSIVVNFHADGTTLLTGQALINADVTGDGKVNGIDAIIIAQYSGKSITAFPKTDGSSLVMGDANRDGKISIGDALSVSNYINEFIDSLGQRAILLGRALDNADVDGDGKITSNDSTLIANYAGCLVSNFPRGSSLAVTCGGTLSTTTPKVDLMVGPANSPSFIHSNGPITINSGSGVTFSWSLTDSLWSLPCALTNASALSANKTGTVTINNITSSKTYTMICYLAGIPYSDSVTVNVASTVITPGPTATPTPTFSPTPTPTPTPTQPYFTFSHKGGTLTAGRDAWTLTLQNGQVGDKIYVNAVLNSPDGSSSISKGTLQVCTITSGTSCELYRSVPSSDAGIWYEDVYINGEFQEKINFTVVAPSGTETVSQSRLYGLSEISDGDIIRGEGDIAVWIIKIVGEKRFKRWLFGPQIFQAYGHLGFNKVKNVSKITLNNFDTAVLIRKVGDEKVYELTDFVPGQSATRRWIPSAQVFLQRGFDFDSVYVVNQREFNFYTEGASLPVSQNTKSEPKSYLKANLSEAMAKFFGWGD